MSEFGGDHAKISAVFLRRSRAYLANGELLQASEKGWGAAAHAAKSYALSRGLEYQSHSDFHDLVTYLRLETRHSQLRDSEDSAHALHRNFYNDNLTAPEIAAYLDHVAALVNVVLQLANLPTVDD